MDGSVLEGTAGAGMILRDHEGSIIFSSCRHLHTCNDVGNHEGVSLALQWSNLPIDIESDCLEAVAMIKSGDPNKSKYVFMVREINSNTWERDSCITHILRSYNSTSHFMTNFNRLQCRTAVWLDWFRRGPGIVGRDCNP